MPDSITPVGTQSHYDPMQGINMLSGVLGLQQQQQQLQIGQGEAQKSQQLMHERQSIQQMMHSGKDDQGQSIVGENGEPDPAKILPALGRMAPLSGQQYAQNILKTHSDKIGLQESARALDINHRNALQGMVQSVAAGMDPQEAVSTMRDYAKQHPEAAPTEKYMEGFVQHIGNAKDPDQRAHLAQSLASMMQPGQAVETRPQNATQDIGGRILQGTTAPAVAGGGFTPETSTKKTLAPQVVRYPNEQLGVMGEGAGAGGNGKAKSGEGPRTAADDAPPPNAPGAIQAAFKQATAEAATHQRETHANDATYGTNMATMQSIRHLVEGGTKSGPGTAEYNRLVGTFATRFGGLKGVSDSQLLGAYLDRQAALLRTQQGLPETNMGQATASSISGNTEYNPDVIKEKNNLNEALAEGLHQYRQGLDRVAGFSGNPSPKVVGAFRSAWADNFDPTAEAYRLALRRGDTETANTIKSRYSAGQLKDLARKGRNMDLLSQGKMPNGG